MSANKNGLTIPAAYAAPDKPFYLSQPFTSLTEPTLVAPVILQAAESDGTLLEPAHIYVVGENNVDAAYVGAVIIQPGGNDESATPGNGITVRTGAGPSTIVEIGTDAEDNNLLYIAGGLGVGQVYDEKYNQPVALQTITIVASDPDCTPTGGAEIFRCAQAAVAQAGAGTVQFNRIQVPKTGAYMMQSEIRMGNTAGPNTVVLPSTLVGGVPVWNSLALGMQEFSTVIAVPYSSVEVIGGDFQAIDTFASSSLTIKTYSQVLFLDSTKVYAITLASNSALWNIGDAGQIKVELIAMC